MIPCPAAQWLGYRVWCWRRRSPIAPHPGESPHLARVGSSSPVAQPTAKSRRGIWQSGPAISGLCHNPPTQASSRRDDEPRAIDALVWPIIRHVYTHHRRRSVSTETQSRDDPVHLVTTPHPPPQTYHEQHGTGTTRPTRRIPSVQTISGQMVALTSTNDPSTALEDQPTSRSFFSRFALPIRSRSTRNVVDFHIHPAEPHRKYNAGDPVKGAVVLAVVKPLRLTHLTVALRGFVRVYKSPNAANEPVSTPDVPSDGVSHFRFLGNGYASLFQDEQVLCADGRLEAGKYEFNFELLFPSLGLPSSIEVGGSALSLVHMFWFLFPFPWGEGGGGGLAAS